MNVAELIRKLQQFPSDANVNAIVVPSGVYDYEGVDKEWVRLFDVIPDPADDGDISVVVQYHDDTSDPLHFMARK